MVLSRAEGLAEVRDDQGRFLPGNPGGPGNPHVAAVGAWRKALVEAVTPEDVGAVTRKLVAKAKEGESWAVKELFDRCLGRPQQRMELDTGEQTWAAMLVALQQAATTEGEPKNGNNQER